jgi:2-methylisocitrate lyase-like PEP mutase family enzyme
MPSPVLKNALLEGTACLVAPGVYDLISALIADGLGFPALYATGYGLVASYLGLPDAGLATYRDMIERIGQIVDRTKTPVIADADTGYGGLLNVRHTVRGYERAGVSAIQLEDQEFPKKCGHTPGRRVIPMNDMVAKIQVATDSRSSPDFLIIARTDARTSLGLDEAIRRGEAYAAAGADLIFIEAPESETELATIAKRVSKPLVANMVNGGKTPLVPAGRLAEFGYRLAIYPAAGFLAAGAALAQVYGTIRQNGITGNEVPFYPFMEFSKLLGFEDIWNFERRYAAKEAETP